MDRRPVRRGTPLRRRGRRGRLRRIGLALVVSCMLHSAVLGAALLPWHSSGPDAEPTASFVLVDLPPAPDAREDTAGLLPAERFKDRAAATEILRRQVDALGVENTDPTGLLADQQQRTAQLEAQYRQEIAAPETAKGLLGEQVAALAAGRAALAAELAEERRRTAKLEKELTARREAEAAALTDMRATYEQLVAALRSEIADKDVALEQARQGLTVAIVDRVLFPSGQATLTPEGRPVIDKVGAALAAMRSRPVVVEGHTDNVPIGPELHARFPSNWELSTARATEVVKRLLEQTRMPSARLSAVGRADTEPVASNDTEEGRRRNRRIEIIILPPSPSGSNDALS
jgi:chemotaxis protein MotB